jgi:hypothetical protein
LAERLWRVLLFGAVDSQADLPYSAAPNFEALREGLPPSGMVMSQIDGGWTIHFGALASTPPTSR